MKLLIAPNAYKGAISAAETARLFAKIAGKDFGMESDLMPVADGGDGLIDVLAGKFFARTVKTRVSDPQGRSIIASYAASREHVAIIEMARASGLALLKKKKLNPMTASSRGTGQLIAHALEKGARRIYIGLGGSASNDAGAGMAGALGFKFLNSAGHELAEGAGALNGLARIDSSNAHTKLKTVKIYAISDVLNPLLGANGSARVYGPQKGATPVQVGELEHALERFARIAKKDTGVSVGSVPGAGAAGGLAAGLLAFCGAEIVPGAEFVLDLLEAERRIKTCDLVITGEGSFDYQTFFGKAPCAIARLAAKHSKPVLLIAGRRENLPQRTLAKHGITMAVSVVDDLGIEEKLSMGKPALYLGQAFTRGLTEYIKKYK
ncbi:MAG: glycerate kinase [Elusimicrobiaceae bacterium]